MMLPEDDTNETSELTFEQIIASAPAIPETTVHPAPPVESFLVARRAPFQPYFEIDTARFIARLIQAVNPLNQTFLLDLPFPDLFGPFWVAFTAVFVTLVCGSLSAWSSYGARWSFRLSPFITSLTLTGLTVFGAPLAHHWVASQYSCPETPALRVICLIGYSMGLMAPIAALCLIVGFAADFLIAAVGAAIVTFSVFQKLQYPLDDNETRARALVPNLGLAVVVGLDCFVCYRLQFR
jgi:hypothetical protein